MDKITLGDMTMSRQEIRKQVLMSAKYFDTKLIGLDNDYLYSNSECEFRKGYIFISYFPDCGSLDGSFQILFLTRKQLFRTKKMGKQRIKKAHADRKNEMLE